jgi:hypothetical protein
MRLSQPAWSSGRSEVVKRFPSAFNDFFIFDFYLLCLSWSEITGGVQLYNHFACSANPGHRYRHSFLKVWAASMPAANLLELAQIYKQFAMLRGSISRL